MTADEQIERLDDRVTRLETRTNGEIVSIHSKLDAVLALINKAMVDGAKNSCPSPGACIVLGENLRATITAHNATMLRVERLELRMMELEKWQGRMFGGVAVLMTLLTLFAPMIRQLLKLE